MVLGFAIYRLGTVKWFYVLLFNTSNYLYQVSIFNLISVICLLKNAFQNYYLLFTRIKMVSNTAIQH